MYIPPTPNLGVNLSENSPVTFAGNAGASMFSGLS